MKWAGVKLGGPPVPGLASVGRAGRNSGFRAYFAAFAWQLSLRPVLCQGACSANHAAALRPLYHGSMLGGAFWPTWRICVGPHHQHQRRTPTSPIPHLLLCFVSLSCAHGHSTAGWAHGLPCRLSGRCLMGADCVWERGGMLHPGTWAHHVHNVHHMRAGRQASCAHPTPHPPGAQTPTHPCSL